MIIYPGRQEFPNPFFENLIFQVARQDNSQLQKPNRATGTQVAR
jgi:hypothetical protein